MHACKSMKPRMASLILILAAITLLVISNFAVAVAAATTGKLSFSVNYIHRDSPQSPFYNSSQTPYESLIASVDRDRFRFSKLSNGLSNIIMAPIAPDTAEYLINIAIGTPPFNIHIIADTGSGLIWTQCVPCKNCFRQTAPKFDPSASSTYKTISCKDCPSLESFFCGSHDKCSYSYIYVDGSFGNGIGSIETLTFDSSSGEKVSVENINMGCTHESKGLFQSTEAGIIGLGRGSLSLISQLGDRIDNQFSYCLVPKTAVGYSSTLNFGPGPYPNLEPFPVSIPLADVNSPFYSVFLQSVMVGDVIVPMEGSNDGSEGNIVIDSGAYLSYLPHTVLNGLIDAFSKVITLPTAQDSLFKLCYKIDRVSIDVLPDVKMDFGNGVVVTFPPLNMFFKVSNAIACLAVLPSSPGMNFIGNFAQQNFLLEYDLGINMVSFTTKDCTKFVG